MHLLRSLRLAGLALLGAAVISPSIRAEGGEKPAGAISQAERAVRSVILRWNAAYRLRDAKALAALESADIEIVDRFGEIYRFTGRESSERLWADSFEQISDRSPAPDCTIERIRFISPGVAIVYVRAHYAAGITLSDGAHTSSFRELNTFVLTEHHGVWLVTVQTVHQRSTAGL